MRSEGKPCSTLKHVGYFDASFSSHSSVVVLVNVVVVFHQYSLGFPIVTHYFFFFFFFYILFTNDREIVEISQCVVSLYLNFA